MKDEEDCVEQRETKSHRLLRVGGPCPTIRILVKVERDKGGSISVTRIGTSRYLPTLFIYVVARLRKRCSTFKDHALRGRNKEKQRCKNRSETSDSRSRSGRFILSTIITTMRLILKMKENLDPTRHIRTRTGLLTLAKIGYVPHTQM